MDHTNANSQKVNNVFMAKAHGFTDGEYQQIMNMLHKDNKEVKQANMTGKATCFSSNVSSHT